MTNISETFKVSFTLNLVNPEYTALPKMGVYYWWCDLEGLKALGIRKCHDMYFIIIGKKKYFLCYIGIGPKSSDSKQMLPDRLKKMHIGGHIRDSMLRKAIAALLKTSYENVIRDFLRKHFVVVVTENLKPWDIEASEIGRYSPPLNTLYNTNGWFYKELMVAKNRWSELMK